MTQTKKPANQARPLSRLQRQTAVDLARRLGFTGEFSGPEARAAIERFLGRPLATLPALLAECRAAFYDGQQRRKRRAGK